MVRSRRSVYTSCAPSILQHKQYQQFMDYRVCFKSYKWSTIWSTTKITVLSIGNCRNLGVINILLINTFILPYILNVTTPRMSHGGMGRCIQLVCVTDVVIQLLTNLMSHRQSYSRVNVIRHKLYQMWLQWVQESVCVRDGYGNAYIKILRNLLYNHPPYEYVIGQIII